MAVKMKTIGVIGLGSIGLRHAKNLIAMGHRVIGYDPDTSRDHALLISGGELADHHYIKDVDAAIIASPSKCHERHLKQYVIRNIPCLVEKPFTLGRPEAMERLLNIADANHTPVMVGHNLRFHPLVIGAKLKLLGKTTVRANFIVRQKSTKPEYLRDGVTLNWAIHEIDLALYLLGPAKVVNAIGNNNEITFTLEHDSGCITTIQADYLTDPEIREFHVNWGSGGIKANIVSEPWQWDEVYKTEMEWFLDCTDTEIIAGTPYYGASGREGLAAVKIALEVNRMAGL